MDSDNELQQLEAEIGRLERALAGERTEARQVTLALRTISATVLLIVTCFVWFNYTHFRGEWSQERLSSYFERELTDLNPVMSAEIQALGRHLLPVYTEEGRRQFRKLTPEITKTVKAQVDGLAKDLQRDAQAKLTRLSDRIEDSTLATISEAYPTLTNESEKRKLEQSFRKATEDALITSLINFDRQFSKDTEALQGELLSFDLRETDESTVDLQKKFIRLWLQLLDEEINKL